MKILIFNWRDPRNPKAGGAEIVTLKHAASWVKSGHKVAWFTSCFPSAQKRETIEGVEIIRKGNFITVYLFAPFFYFLSKEKFDIVIDEIHGLPFFTPLFVKKPKIAFIHEVAGEIWDYMYSFPINKIGRILEHFYFRLYSDVEFWTDAESSINDLELFGIKRSNCHAIACPVSNESLSGLPLKESNPTFLFVSRIVKMKGIENILETFKIIAKNIIDARLWIVGEGEADYLQKLKKRVKDYKLEEKIKFFGKVPENEKLVLMRKATLMLHASVKEGWGLVVLEAASQATPAVVYNVSGLRNSVKDGRTGIVLNENSPEEMAVQALKLIGNKEKYQNFQKNCLVWVKSLSWEESTRESLSLLKKVSKAN